jgi:hypothetical protein
MRKALAVRRRRARSSRSTPAFQGQVSSTTPTAAGTAQRRRPPPGPSNETVSGPMNSSGEPCHGLSVPRQFFTCHAGVGGSGAGSTKCEPELPAPQGHQDAAATSPTDDAVVKLLWLAIFDIDDKRARERENPPPAAGKCSDQPARRIESQRVGECWQRSRPSFPEAWWPYRDGGDNQADEGMAR